MSDSPVLNELLHALMNPALKAIDLSLGRTQRHLEALANPESRIPPVVHVAGTNGKGSTIAFMRAALEAAGYRCHVYTSPHLVHLRERFVLAGQEASDALLLQRLQRVKDRTADYPLTYFEALTVCAFELFAEHEADITLLEVGMGGRFDATNVVTPLLSVITPVGADHQAYLGDTVAKIAYEKAGVIKPGVACVMADQPEADAAEVIMQVAKEQGSQILRPQAQAFENLSLAGEHQQANAATALAALNYLKAHGFDRLEDMEQSFSQARWPARLQQLTQGPLPEMLPPQATLWLDSGHNGPAAQQLARWIQAQDMPLHLIFSMSQGHDVAEFLTPMLPYLASCHVIEIPDEPLSQPLCALDAAARGVCASVQSHQNIEDAVRATVSRISGDYGIIITGSLYLAGKVLEKNS